jgi:hypothetical protein
MLVSLKRHSFCEGKAHAMKGGRYMLGQRSSASVSERSAVAPPRLPEMMGQIGITELALTLDVLMKRWCTRGAHRPIQILLKAYPGPLWHAYHQMELAEALEQLKGMCQGDLEAEERGMVVKALHILKK